MRRGMLWLPLAVFVLMAVLFVARLSHAPEAVVRSRLAGQPLPAFALPAMVAGKPGVNDQSFRGGQPRLLNIFASWCVPCVAEAPQLLQLKAAGVPIDAVAIRDTPDAVSAFLARHGDPYAAVGSDRDSAVQLSLGSSGVPETFVVDGSGRIAYQHIGAIREEDGAVLLSELARAR